VDSWYHEGHVRWIPGRFQSLPGFEGLRQSFLRGP
jgi:hypothetical protein